MTEIKPGEGVFLRCWECNKPKQEEDQFFYHHMVKGAMCEDCYNEIMGVQNEQISRENKRIRGL